MVNNMTMAHMEGKPLGGSIDGTNMYDFIISGAGNIIINEKYLNKINVFPVPDGDTGTNLALTMRTIISKAERNISIGKTMASVAKAAIENAYGNSGMIFAQFLYGFAESVKQKDILTVQEFAASSAQAVQYAYSAVSSPKEGTILTVMREWTEELKNSTVYDTLENWFSRSFEKAQIIVEQTKSMMKVLRDNNVVDSGAKGFLLFVEGILAQVRHGSNASSILEMQILDESTVEINHENVSLDYPFCSQFVIKLHRPDESDEALMKSLSTMGDSLVITGGKPFKQVHIHTDAPDKVMALLLKNAEVASHKVDDMALQQAMVQNPKNRVGILTDSIADLPASAIKEAMGLVIPMNVIHDGTAYLDKVTMTPEIFYNNIDTMALHPTSAQPTIASVERALAIMLSHYDEVLGIFVSEKMSGLYQHALKVAERLSTAGKKIRIIDSKQNSAAEGLLVLEAIRLANTGMSLDEIGDKIAVLRNQTHIYVSVDTLKFMIKGGRVSKAQGLILSKLHLQPVVSIDDQGKGSIWAKTLSRKQAFKKILKKFQEDAQKYGIHSYGLVYADDAAALEGFRDKIAKIAGKAPAFVEPISSAVALNAGRGAAAIAYMKG